MVAGTSRSLLVCSWACVSRSKPRPVSGWTICELLGFDRTKTLRQRAIQLAQFVLLPGYRSRKRPALILKAR